ncbi:hypothetical protein D3C71_1890590 [compost metagenome]
MRRQHAEEVPGKNAQNTDMEQVRGQPHALFIQHLAGASTPGVLPIVVAQPTADQEDRPGDIRIDIEKEKRQKVHD